MKTATCRNAFHAVLFTALALGARMSHADEPRSLTESAATVSATEAQALVTPPLRLVVAAPKKRLVLQGAAFGAAFGAALGVTVGAASEEEAGALLGLIFLTPTFGAGGTVAGLFTRRDRGNEGLRPGETVRVVAFDPIQGTFLRVDQTGVVLGLPDGQERVVSFDAGHVLEVRRSTRLTKLGAMTGLVTAGGVALANISCGGGCSTGEILGAVGLTALTTAVGAGVGALFKVHDWRAITPEGWKGRSLSDSDERRQISFGLAPTPGRGVFGQVSIRWR